MSLAALLSGVGPVVAAEPAAVAQLPAGAQAVSDPNLEFSRAGTLYEEGRFAVAAQALEEVAARGFESPALYFNLANALLKSGELGKAIVYYERARALDPRAADIRQNLAYARTLVVDVVPETEGSAFLERLARFEQSFTAEEAIRVASALLWLGAGAVAVLRLSRAKRRRNARAAALVGVIAFGLAGSLAGIKVHEAVGQDRAVLVAAEVPVRSGPGESYSSRFSLHEGTAVRVARQAAGWTEIELSPSLSGWVPSTVLMSL